MLFWKASVEVAAVACGVAAAEQARGVVVLDVVVPVLVVDARVLVYCTGAAAVSRVRNPVVAVLRRH